MNAALTSRPKTIVGQLLLLGGAVVLTACATPEEASTPRKLEYVEIDRPWGPPVYFYRPAQSTAANPAIVLSKVP